MEKRRKHNYPKTRKPTGPRPTAGPPKGSQNAMIGKVPRVAMSVTVDKETFEAIERWVVEWGTNRGKVLDRLARNEIGIGKC